MHRYANMPYPYNVQDVSIDCVQTCMYVSYFHQPTKAGQEQNIFASKYQ